MNGSGSASGQHNKEERWSKKEKSFGNEPLFHYQSLKKRNKCVNPAYSPRRVKQELILYGSDAAARTVLGKKDQIKGSWHFKFY